MDLDLNLDFGNDSNLKSIDLGSVPKSSTPTFNISRSNDMGSLDNSRNKGFQSTGRSPSLSIYETTSPSRNNTSTFGGGGGGGGGYDDDDDDFIGLLANKKKTRQDSPSNQQNSFNSTPSHIASEVKVRPTPISDNELLSDSLFNTDMENIDLNQEADNMTSVNLDDLDSNFGNGNKSGGMSGPSFPNIANSPQPQVNTSNYSFGPDITSSTSQMSFEDIQKAKFDLVCKFERLRDRGVRMPKTFSMHSDYDEMKHEYERLIYNRKLEGSVKAQRKMLIGLISGIEFLNNKFDPFDVKLDGWSGQVNDEINDYDDVFEELFEKYKDSTNMAPELRLMFSLAGSAFMFHLNNTIFNTAVQQDPSMAQQYANTAASAMNPGGGGIGGLMSSLFNMKNGMNDQTTKSSVPAYNPMDGPPFSNPRDAPPRRSQPDMPPPTDFDALLDNITST